MEMTLLKLEHAAVIPSLWPSIGSACKSVPDGDGQQSRCVHNTKRILCGPRNHDNDGDVSWGNNIYDSFLVPGGWYFILFHDNQLSLFDLGNIVLDHKTRVLASAETQYGHQEKVFSPIVTASKS
jgi:hypothetical protein